MMWEAERILVLGAHTDDYELGAGGTLARIRSYLYHRDVTCAYFSACEERVPEGFPKDQLSKEAENARRVLGVADKQLIVNNFPVDNFPAHRQEILESLWNIKREFNPELVITHASADFHQDHRVIHEESVRAFKDRTVLGYAFPWNELGVNRLPCVSGFGEQEMAVKLAALDCYRSQRNRSYMSAEFQRAWARVSAVNSGEPYAERFEVISWHI